MSVTCECEAFARTAYTTIWWGYLHKNGDIITKRWLPTPSCNRCFAIEEMEAGNDNIVLISDLVLANHRNQASLTIGRQLNTLIKRQAHETEAEKTRILEESVEARWLNIEL